MSVDTKQERMSVIGVGLPSRGCLVDPEETGFDKSNRMAATYMYAGGDLVGSGGAGTPVEFLLFGRKFRGVGRGTYRGLQ